MCTWRSTPTGPHPARRRPGEGRRGPAGRLTRARTSTKVGAASWWGIRTPEALDPGAAGRERQREVWRGRSVGMSGVPGGSIPDGTGCHPVPPDQDGEGTHDRYHGEPTSHRAPRQRAQIGRARPDLQHGGGGRQHRSRLQPGGHPRLRRGGHRAAGTGRHRPGLRPHAVHRLRLQGAEQRRPRLRDDLHLGGAHVRPRRPAGWAAGRSSPPTCW